MIAWNERGLRFYREYDKISQSPFVRPEYLFQMAVDFNYARQWIHYWKSVQVVDRQLAGMVE